MDIVRVNSYHDLRFSQRVLYQHGCYLIENMPYEVDIISEFEAVVRGENDSNYSELIEVFRFYTPHITKFYDNNHVLIQEFTRTELLRIGIEQIQPSQFYVDEDKVNAIRHFIRNEEDIIIQVLPHQGKYISLDGHTRLYYAVINGWESVKAVIETSDDWIYKFANEAKSRNVYTPKDLILLSHKEYEEKWNRFCDAFFGES